MASTDATPFPMKNVAYRVTFPILDADGDLVTGATSPDSEVSKDGGAFADCTNEATEIATNSGMYYLDLTSTEMNADTVAVIVKSGNGKTTPIVLYPQEAADIKVAVTHWVATAVATPTTNGVPEVDITHIAGAAVSTSTAQLGVNTVQAGGTAWGSGAITAASIATDAIGASELAADAATEIGTAVWATAARTLTAATNVTSTGAAVPITAGGLVSADVTAISTGTTAANNAELFFDGTGYAGGTTKLGVDVVSISGDTTAADNAELMFDGTGYAGGTTKLGVNAVALSGSTAAADNAEAGYTGIVTGTAITGTLSTTVFTTNLTEATDDHYNGRTITFTSGVLAGQQREITDYNGTTKAITVAAMTDAPSNTDAFFIA